MRLLTTIAVKKTDAMIHHARLRAESSEKSCQGRARWSARTAIEATKSTPSTSNPVCNSGERLFRKFIRRSLILARAQLLERARHSIQTRRDCEQRRYCEYPWPGSQGAGKQKGREPQRSYYKGAVALSHLTFVMAAVSDPPPDPAAALRTHL